MKIMALLLAFCLAAAGCSDPVAPGDCPAVTPAPGRPDFDLVGALRAEGATVEEKGIAFDLKVFIDAPTEVLSVNGQEVRRFRFCTGDQVARALGHYGVGVYASSPPDIVIDDPRHHLFALDRTLATYVGADGGLLTLLTGVMGPEVALPSQR